MKNRTKNILWGCAIFLMAFMMFAFGNTRSKLAISYLSQTNEMDHALAFFTISNAGNINLSSYKTGTLEIMGQGERVKVGCETRLSELQPGECDIATVYLPAEMKKPWRFSIYYSRAGSTYLGAHNYATSDWIH